jgi:hypothetical protein
MQLDPEEFNTVKGWHLRGRYLKGWHPNQEKRDPVYMKMVLPDGSELPLYHREQTCPATLEEGLAEGAEITVHPPPLASLPISYRNEPPI